MFGWRDKTSNFKLRNGFTCLITTQSYCHARLDFAFVEGNNPNTKIYFGNSRQWGCTQMIMTHFSILIIPLSKGKVQSKFWIFGFVKLCVHRRVEYIQAFLSLLHIFLYTNFQIYPYLPILQCRYSGGERVQPILQLKCRKNKG